MKKDNMITIMISAVILALIYYSSDAKQGAMIGISLCENVIIPSLLPILILTNIMTKSSASRIIESTFGIITEKALRLPRITTSAIILGLISGYPAGTIMTHQLYNEGKISRDDARHIMSFNFCGGMAFIITAVGTIHLKSTRIGVVLFLSSIISSIIIGIFHSFSKAKIHTKNHSKSYIPFTDAMIESVDITMHSIINMCAYIILFSAVTSILPIPDIATPIIEITNGVITDKYSISLPMYAFFLAFGGLCVHFQLIGYLKEMGVRYLYFLTNRICAGGLAYGIMRIYLHFFPQSDEVFSNIAEKSAKLTQVNNGLCIIMIIGCVVMIFDIENKKYKLI